MEETGYPINVYLIATGIGLSIVIIFILLWRAKVTNRWFKRIAPEPDFTPWQEKLNRKEVHLANCQDAQDKALFILSIYKHAERVLNTGGWYWTLDKDPDEVVYTDNFASIFDVVQGSIITAKQLIDIIHIDDQQRVKDQIKDACLKGSGSSYVIDYRVVRRNDRHDRVRSWGEVIEVNENNVACKMRGCVLLLESDVD